MHKVSDHKQEIIFLNRAYNDLDIQLPLVAAFAQDERFSVRVVGYPSDGAMGSPQNHEAVPYIKDTYGVSFETLLDKAPAPLFLRVLYKIERCMWHMEQKDYAPNFILALPLKAVHRVLLKIMQYSLKGKLDWLEEVTRSWEPLLIVTDEILAQKGRSYMMDKIVRDKAEQGSTVYMVQTGHNIYNDPRPNKSKNARMATDNIEYNQTPAKRFFVPSKLDRHIASQFCTNENIQVHGNLRMDQEWVEILHQKILVPPYVNKEKHFQKLPQGKPKIVFMLSKLGYGVEVEELKKTIKAVANMEGVACAIKPHTRDMKFDFMSKKEIGNISIVSDVPSTLLIEWGDIILFTGSSIVFHAMLMNKGAGFLKYCQYLKTIFDEDFPGNKFNSLDEFRHFIEHWRDNGPPSISESHTQALNAWLSQNVHGEITGKQTAMAYKDTILSDMGLSTSENNAV